MNVIGIITYTYIQMHMHCDREIKLNHTELDIAFLNGNTKSEESSSKSQIVKYTSKQEQTS